MIWTLAAVVIFGFAIWWAVQLGIPKDSDRDVRRRLEARMDELSHRKDA